MPCNYKDYPANWKTEIRPAILERDENKCKFCNIPNRIVVTRGTYHGAEVYQDDDGFIFDANTSEKIGGDYVGTCGPNMPVEIVLTVAHLDHDISHNDYENLAALCQRCHNRHDRADRNKNRREKKLKKAPELF